MASKRMNAAYEKIGADKTTRSMKDAIQLVCESSSAKFEESFDISLHIGVDPRKHMVRGSSTMPNGLGRSKKIAVFATGEAAEKAKKAGADRVGMEDLVDELKKAIDYDVVIATPDAMRLVGTLGKVLGPKGLMPNPKLGTVTADPAAAVETALKGQVMFKVDKAGIIHCSVGKCSFNVDALQGNIAQLVSDVKKCKPAAAKGQYIKKLYVNSTMGPSVPVDTSELL